MTGQAQAGDARRNGHAITLENILPKSHGVRGDGNGGTALPSPPEQEAFVVNPPAQKETPLKL